MLKELLKQIYLSRKLKKMLRYGLPEYLSKPLNYLITNRLDGGRDQEIFHNIELIRSRIVERSEEKINVFSSPLPKSSGEEVTDILRPLPGEIKKLSIHQIANSVSIDSRFGPFIYLCADGCKAKTILELGACVGISACYMASASSCRKIITVEASEELAKIARANISLITSQYSVINSLFDEALDHILANTEEGIDLAWIDGHHEKIATIHYFQRLIPILNKGAVVLFDDIHWSNDMYDAWKILSKFTGFSHTIDIGRIGLGIWDKSELTKPLTWKFTAPRLVKAAYKITL
jgi:predicted O-methyltransferase YrrM